MKEKETEKNFTVMFFNFLSKSRQEKAHPETGFKLIDTAHYKWGKGECGEKKIWQESGTFGRHRTKRKYQTENEKGKGIMVKYCYLINIRYIK